ncbi:MAG: porin [Pseudomonadota bacterium]
MRTLLLSLFALLLALPAAADPPDKQSRELADRPAEAKKAKKKNKFDVGGKVYVLWAVSDLQTEPANEFSFSRARVRLRWIRERILEAKLQVEFSGMEEGLAAADILRDAYLAVGDPKRWHARVTAGQMKRPFSRIELRSISRLPTIRRGVSNGWMVRDLGFGSRDLGLQVDGTAGKGQWFGYAVGAYNGSGRNADEGGLDGSKDVAARLEFRPAKWVELGVNTSIRTFDRAEGADLPRFTWMAGGDVVFRGGKWVRITGEGLVGEAWLLPDRPLTWSALLMISSRAVKLPFLRARLEPLVKGELTVRDAGDMDTGIWMLATGVNLHLLDHFRLMVQGEFIWPGDDEATRLECPQRMRLLIQLALDV